MKVNFVGNICNNHYAICKGMRAHGIDAHLYYPKPYHPQHLPESEDPILERERPDWLHPFPHPRNRLSSQLRVGVAPLDEIGRADIIHTHGAGVVWGVRTGRPVVWHPFGGDLRHWTRYGDWLMAKLRAVNPALPNIRVPRLPDLLTPLAMRRAGAQVSAILIGWYDKQWESGFDYIDRFDLWPRVHRLSLGLDMGFMHPATAAERRALKARLLPQADPRALTIFHPTRMLFRDSNGTWGYKANDRLFRAAARVRAEGHSLHLVVVDKGDAIGEEVKEARALIAQLGLSDVTTWVPFMPRADLKDWYLLADLTVDEFASGAMGSLAYEVLSCGRPLMTFIQTEAEGSAYFDRMHWRALYPEFPPILNCRTVEQIAEALRMLASNSAKMDEIAAASGRWAEQYLDVRNLAAKIIQVYEGILSKQRNRSASSVRSPSPAHSR